MSSVFCPLIAPTVVEHAVNIKFVDRDETNLVVAKKNVLQVFKIVKREEDVSSPNSDGDVAAVNVDQNDDFTSAGLEIRASRKQMLSKLVLISEQHLFGTIVSMGTIRAQDYDETGLEYLLVAFKAAKASLLCWDQDKNEIATISLHSFERDEYRAPFANTEKCVMKIDPLSRVATMNFFGDYLAFLPVTQKDELLLNDQDDSEKEQGPISNSFVLSALQLQDDITQLIDFTYVDGYREPALALLYASEGSAPGLLKTWRKDTTKLVVLTLDMQAKERTAIFEKEDLPADLQSICAVPNPLGGCLLIGTNELIYVDSASRVVALAVNGHAKRSSDLPMRDYAKLNLLLEGCLAVPLLHRNTLDGILLVLADGRSALLTLNLDGRTVSSLHLRIVAEDLGGEITTSAATSAAVFEDRRLFLGSATGESKLMSWKREARTTQEGSAGSGTDPQSEGAENEKDASNSTDELEDLYGDEVVEKKFFGSETTAFDLRFIEHDSMINLGPVTGATLGSAHAGEQDDRQDGVGVPAELALVSGSGRAGKLTVCRRHVTPEVLGKFEAPDWHALWAVKARSTSTTANGDFNDQFDTYLMASSDNETQVFTIETSFVEKTDSEFETSDRTVSIGSLLGYSCIVQVCTDIMRIYDSDLKLLELKPAPESSTIVSASIVDPFVLLQFDNSRLALYAGLEKTKELEEISHGLDKLENIVCATLYAAAPDSVMATSSASRSRKRKRDGKDSKLAETNEQSCFCCTINANGELNIYELPSMKHVFRAEASHLPKHLYNNDANSYTNGVQAELSSRHITELMFKDLGQVDRSPFLVIRTSDGTTVVYQAYLGTNNALRFSKITESPRHKPISSSEHVDDVDAEPSKVSEMVFCEDIAGHACIFLNHARYPTWLLKTDQSLPAFHAAGMSDVQCLSGFSTLDARNGFIYCDYESTVRICRFPPNFTYDMQWSSKSMNIGKSVHAIAYYAPLQVYAILTTEEQHFEIPDDEDDEWQPMEDHREDLPLLSHGAVELVDASTMTTIDRYELAPNEQGLCLKSVSLTIATEYTKKRRPCLAVSSGILRGEDLAVRGAVYVFDVVEVVPEITAPDAKYRLKCLCREEVRAAATTLCEVDGYLLSSQGQKVVIRSLEEDERLTPVAFVDLGLATTTSKCLRSMIIFGDVHKGVRFVGFGEEPFRMTNFGRDFEAMDVSDVEFMVDGRNLYFTAADTVGNLRILQYDPENPTTLAGSRLIRKADIHAGHVISSMLSLPQVSDDGEQGDVDRTMVICASSDGSLSVVVPISDRSYRRLYTIQAQLSSTEMQTAGLNARAYRLCTVDGLTTNASRGILDGQLLSSFHKLSGQEQVQMAKKSGVGADNVLNDLSELSHAISSI